MFAFTTFLSHRYKSPDENLFFFKLFEDLAEVQFEVDEATFSTNVTRIERMIRAADAFIGIYPFPGTPEEARQPEELKKASRYFRLELDLAIRSRKPAIIFYDQRYGNLLRGPNNILAVPYNFREITSTGQSPKTAIFKEKIGDFLELVTANMQYSTKQWIAPRTTIGIAVPHSSTGTNYIDQHIQIIESTLENNGYYDRKILPWPPVFNHRAFILFHEADCIITDLGEDMARTGLPAYLHGQFVPMVRLRQVHEGQDASTSSLLENVLFGDIEVGYKKDTVVWDTEQSLEVGLQERLSTLKEDVRRVNTINEAEAYFRGAALRKEAVFLSYSGKDRERAADLSQELKKHFHKVFDYRDGESIQPGQPWIDEIFQQLSSSAIGIPLLSEDYFKSGNCEHEAQQMVAQYDNGKMKVLPIKLYEGALDSPPWMQHIQYLRYTDFTKAEDVAKEVVQLTAK